MCHRGAFRKDIIKKCVFCKAEDNIKFKKVKEELIDKLNKLDAKTKNKILLKIMNIIIIVKNYLNLKMRKRMVIMKFD